MSGTHRSSGAAVFVDQSGRRRRVLMIAGVLLGTLMLAMAALLIGGAFSTTRLDAVEWPEGGTGAPERSVPAATTSASTTPPTPTATARTTRPVAPSATPTRRRTATPAPSRSQVPAAGESTAPAVAPTSSDGPATQAPSTSAPPSPTDPERTRPGQAKQPPGLGSDKTPGPKK